MLYEVIRDPLTDIPNENCCCGLSRNRLHYARVTVVVVVFVVVPIIGATVVTLVMWLEREKGHYFGNEAALGREMGQYFG